MRALLIYFQSSRAKLNWNGFKDPTREIEREKEKEDAVPYTNKSIRDPGGQSCKPLLPTEVQPAEKQPDYGERGPYTRLAK